MSANATDPGRAPRPWLKPTVALGRAVPALRADRSVLSAQALVRYGYRIADIGFLVGQHVACEVVSLPTITRIPTTPIWFLGVANLRGGLVPIFDLRVLLGLTAERASEARFGLIFDRGEQAVGIPVAEYPRPLAGLELLPRLPPLPAAAREFVAMAHRQAEALWLEFDHRRFFESVARRMTGQESLSEN